MAKIKLASYIKSIHGRIGNLIYYCAYGIQYVRGYTKPRNPRTEAQQANRAALAQAVEQWHSASPSERSYYNRMAQGRRYSGYNLFISMRMKGITTRMLRQISRIQAGAGSLPGKDRRAGTSVMYTSPIRHGSTNPVFSPICRTGPPENMVRAA